MRERERDIIIEVCVSITKQREGEREREGGRDSQKMVIRRKTNSSASLRKNLKASSDGYTCEKVSKGRELVGALLPT